MREIGGCRGSRNLATIAPTRSWRKFLMKNPGRNEKQEMRRIGCTVRNRGVGLIRHCRQGLRYALIVLPCGQHRASLRACPQWEPLKNDGEK